MRIMHLHNHIFTPVVNNAIMTNIRTKLMNLENFNTYASTDENPHCNQNLLVREL